MASGTKCFGLKLTVTIDGTCGGDSARDAVHGVAESIADLLRALGVRGKVTFEGVACSEGPFDRSEVN